MKKKHLILGAILLGILGLFILFPKKEEVVIKSREEIIKIEKEKKLQEDLKEAKKELEETVKRNKAMIKEMEEKEIEEEKALEEIKKEILSEIDEVKRSEKLDGLLEEIDKYKYSREFSIPALVELKGKLPETEIRKINERLYKLYRSTDEFDKAEKIEKELNGGGNIDGEDDKKEL
ncbi:MULTISPECIES: hypothetical protein [Psychrilyobacter]|uniref:Uncharacterized protein n=1 Tax=Psychrilyobacter piezotolerans TaxID=2293438 RepID=A0ABX9KF64_9FUSO|nr:MULTISPECIES: hypothetical protein [Psychrilyobacter]MCS5421545.1 hypothetical protein [Psychrilyobacter sp. S5]NDI78668.1 hypothetical protein [Psychrilyobacter piezotolerans]RDE60020.1 hypothetical protein DV867_11790 [Psychrilyobacter sp. S5]REI40247.1 hypothetical protein DYH56_11790 [Psychrilyobacter piezotolerans]